MGKKGKKYLISFISWILTLIIFWIIWLTHFKIANVIVLLTATILFLLIWFSIMRGFRFLYFDYAILRRIRKKYGYAKNWDYLPNGEDFKNWAKIRKKQREEEEEERIRRAELARLEELRISELRAAEKLLVKELQELKESEKWKKLKEDEDLREELRRQKVLDDLKNEGQS